MDSNDIAAIVAAVIAAQGGTPATPVASAPVIARIASPFRSAGSTAARPSSIATEAMRLFPADRHAQRVHIALSRTPGFTCSVDTTATLPDGSEVPSALHGFTVAKVTGAPCTGVSGLAKGEACPGTIR